MIILILQILTFIIYVGLIFKKFGVLPSISQSYYEFKGKGYFTLFCYFLALPMIAYSKGFYPEVATEGDYTVFFFLGTLLAFTGAAADFRRDNISNVVHLSGVGITVLSVLLGLIFQYNIMFPSIGAAISSVAIYFLVKKNRTTWLEINVFLWIISGLINLVIK